MTPRYDQLLEAIAASNLVVTQMFLFAAFAVLAYVVLGWLPAWLIRPVRYLYLATVLVMFAGVLVLQA